MKILSSYLKNFNRGLGPAKETCFRPETDLKQVSIQVSFGCLLANAFGLQTDLIRSVWGSKQTSFRSLFESEKRPERDLFCKIRPVSDLKQVCLDLFGVPTAAAHE